MEAIILIGIQATGKSTFYRERFFQSHIRINLDMLKTRRKETLLIESCLDMPHPFVVDNTNPTKEDRVRYITLAKKSRFVIHGYYFSSKIEEATKRNDLRPLKEQVPVVGIKGTLHKLQLPDYSEGFDKLYYVTISPNDGFAVEDWKEEHEV